MKQMTQKDFIYKSKETHGDRFDYSKTIYKNTKNKVIVSCLEHGDFLTNPLNHIKGQVSCRKCFKISQKIILDKINKNNQKEFTTESFIKKAKEIHGDRYDYSEFIYNNRLEKSTIICKEHGRFKQSAALHIVKKSNCPTCAKRSNREEFIKKAELKHSKGSFDYSKVIYIDSDTKVIIKCLTCNETFEQTPLNHLKMKLNRCNKCKGKHSFSNKEFIEASKNKFGDKFNYNKVEYVDLKTNIFLKCNDCGSDLYLTPDSHFKGMEGGCLICLKNRKTKEHSINFFKIVKDKFGDELDLSMVDYVSIRKKIILKCTKKGHIFKQTPHSTMHSSISACPICYFESQRKKTLDFKNEATKLHGDIYCYNLVEYETAKINVDIKCKKCDTIFSQNPSTHLKGSGCQNCANYGFNKLKPGILYYILIDGKYYKIGITNRSIKERFLKDFDRIEVIKEWYYDDGEECYNMEQYYLKEFEWAKVNNVNILDKGGNSELFNRDILNLDFI